MAPGRACDFKNSKHATRRNCSGKKLIRMKTTILLRLVLAVILLAPTCALLRSLEEKEIDVIPNPHDDANQEEVMTSCSASLQSLMQPHYLITKPIMTTQVDTFQEITYAKVLSVSVPIYRMKQPRRLSSAEYGFSLILVRDLATHANVHETHVDRERALDSWFVGYRWAPIIYGCSKNNSDNLHVGWKFTRRSDVNNDNNGNEFFYALLVDINKRQKTGWMVAHVMTEL